jgi:hypothetical protein
MNSLEHVDWSFPNLNNSGIHSIHWYPATYLSAIPGTLIPELAKQGGTILDPFCGSGTTGVESIRLGFDFVGIDTNPVALLMSEAKLAFLSPRTVESALGQVLQNSQGMFAQNIVPKHPNHDELAGWYHSETLSSLNGILNSILLIESRLVQRTMLAVFSSILKGCSSQGKHWGWVCDNVKPKRGEIVFKDALAIFSGAALEFAKASDNALKAAQVHSPKLTRELVRRKSLLLRGDCIERMLGLQKNSIDLIMTSPPYYGVADYVKSQRLSYLWFDREELASDCLGYRDFEHLRSQEAGARSNRHRSNSHGLYMDFMGRFFAACHRALKSGASMTLVVGESPSRAGTIEELIASATLAGFSLEFRRGRDIKANRRRLMAKVKGEDVLVFSR